MKGAHSREGTKAGVEVEAGYLVGSKQEGSLEIFGSGAQRS